jgi:hypothetical protein
MNTTPLNFTDEILSGFLDGELPEREMAAVRAALEQDISLADRLAALAQADRLVREHAAALDRQPMPAAVLAMLDRSEASRGARVLQGPWQHLRQYTGRPLALAASVILVLGLAVGWLNRTAPFDPAAGLPALAQYADSLESIASGTPVSIGAATLVTRFSFRNQDQQYCRQYQLSAPGYSAESIACRLDAGWTLVASIEAPAQTAAEFRPASSATAQLDAVLDTLMQGPALDLDSEAALIRQGWRD